MECGEEQGVKQGIIAAAEDDGAADADGDEDTPGHNADDEAHPKPRGQDADPHGFPLKDSYTLDLKLLPAKVANIAVQVANFGGGGLGNVKALHARVVDASNGDPVAARDLFVATKPLAKGAGAQCTVALLLKVYKEYAGASQRVRNRSIAVCEDARDEQTGCSITACWCCSPSVQGTQDSFQIHAILTIRCMSMVTFAYITLCVCVCVCVFGIYACYILATVTHGQKLTSRGVGLANYPVYVTYQR